MTQRRLKLTATSLSFLVLALLTACSSSIGINEEDFEKQGHGVLVLCEGNYQYGNSTVSYYDTQSKVVENAVFYRANDRRLGDTGQSITLGDGVAYIAVENSGIIWAMDTKTFRVRGQLEVSQTEHMVNPRYIHLLSKQKAYVTDLYSPYITIFNPTTMQYTGSIATGQATTDGYASTERLVQWDKWVFTNCWCYSKNILVIDSETDAVCDSIVLTSWQPKSMVMDPRGKLWVVTDGGSGDDSNLSNETSPHLYRIDATTRQVELDLAMPTDEASVDIALSPTGGTLYILNNDIYRMSVTDSQLPSTPFITAPVDADGTRHKLYGLNVDPNSGDIYVADAVDYRQSGVVYRYSYDGQEIDHFRVGINPNGFAFTDAAVDIPDESDEDTTATEVDHSLVNRVYEYMPAPGHQVNGFTIIGDFIHDGATMQEACETVLAHWKKQWMVSLGGQGGYVIAGFDHHVTNSGGDYDLAIKGNPYDYQSEPGIVWVMQDENGDGLPNDTWYELAGSEYSNGNETRDYAITYYKPTSAQQDIAWTDNQGGSGIIPYMSTWNKHDSYFQDWIPTETDAEGREYHTFYGSRLLDTHTFNETTYMSQEPPFNWGYADNLGSDYMVLSAFSDSKLGYFKISQAVDRNGQYVNLPYIDFVKVQTAQTGWTPNLGEISTEVYGIWDIHSN